MLLNRNNVSIACHLLMLALLPLTIADDKEPTIKSIDHVESTETNATYNVKWNLDAEVALPFVVQVCDLSQNEELDKNCTTLDAPSKERSTSVVLRFYTEYKVRVDAKYAENDVKESKPESVTTIVGPPGPVSAVAGTQADNTDIIYVVWSQPEEMNGPVDFYRVLCYFDNFTQDTPDQKLDHRVELPETGLVEHVRIGVRAVNLLDGKELVGPSNIAFVVVGGLEGPSMVNVTAITRSSLTVKIESTTSSQTFFQIEYANKTYQGGESSVLVDDLAPHTVSHLYTSTCIKTFNGTTKCSTPPFMLSNVVNNAAEPGIVDELTVKPVGKTVELHWKDPKVRNGIIDGYEVSFTPLKGKTQVKNLRGSQNHFVCGDACSNRYTFSIRAYNIDLNTKENLYGPSWTILVDTTGTGGGSNWVPWVLLVLVILAAAVAVFVLWKKRSSY